MLHNLRLGDRVEAHVGQDPDITIIRRQKDQRITNVVARRLQTPQDRP